MNKILKVYEALFLGLIYIIIAFYSVRAMLNLINEAENPSSLLKVILLDSLWLTLIVVLGALLVSLSFKNKTRR
jgi:amino acid transporter